MARIDPHSYTDDTQPRVRHFVLHARVDFEARQLTAEVTLHLAQPTTNAATLDLDTRALSIDGIRAATGDALAFTLHPADPILGARLAIELPAAIDRLTIRYRTSPEASALQWLSPAQTLGKRQPFLFSQCQAIHARSVLPCQDTASIRQTYDAILDVPSALRAVMAAEPLRREERGDRALEHFTMPQSIPPYLFAFAVGELASRELSRRCRVWGEPGCVDAAAWEFADVERMLHAAEALFGPYDWERFDLLVMPPSFPYGGMENPRLTFLTPALLAGDRSLVNVVAHELAHSWSGNLVTQATAEHFWLNEGFTVFAERRILAALSGQDEAMLHAALGARALEQTIAQLAAHPELTRLHTQLAGIDPDEAFSIVPYEKGYLFLKTLEAHLGEERFDRLLARWFARHRFGAVTTADFVRLCEELEPGALASIDASGWLDRPGLPDGWRPRSDRLLAIEAFAGTVPSPEATATWSATEWQLFLEATPRPATPTLCRALDEQFALRTAKNPEVQVAFLVLAVESGDDSVLPDVDAMLARFGRMKYLKPLYRALCKRPSTRAHAEALFARLKSGYHPIAVQVVQAIFKAPTGAATS